MQSKKICNRFKKLHSKKEPYRGGRMRLMRGQPLYGLVRKNKAGLLDYEFTSFADHEDAVDLGRVDFAAL